MKGYRKRLGERFTHGFQHKLCQVILFRLGELAIVGFLVGLRLLIGHRRVSGKWLGGFTLLHFRPSSHPVPLD